jgi:glycine cleavage system H protein
MSIKYTEDHEWLNVEGDTAIVGITHHAQDALGDVVFVELPEPGTRLDQKAVAGDIIEVNEALRADPALANTDPLGAGWFFKVKLSDPSQLDSLMDAAAYQALTGA